MAGFGKAFDQAFVPANTASVQGGMDIIKNKILLDQQKAYEAANAASLNTATAGIFKNLSDQSGDPSLYQHMGEIIKNTGNNLAGAKSLNELANKAYDQQLMVAKMKLMLTTFQNQGANTPVSSIASPGVDAATGQPASPQIPNTPLIPKMNIGGMDFVNPQVQAQLDTQKKNIDNSASLKLDAQKKFQDALPVISSAVQSLDSVQSLAQQLPDYKATVGNQVGARAQAAAATFAKDPAVTKYLATTARVGPSLTRLNIGTSNRINVNELEATAKGLGDITTPLSTKIDLLDKFRNSVVGPLKVEAQSAGFTPDALKQQYPEVYQAIYTRPVVDTKTGQMGYVPNEKFQAAIKSGRFKRA